MDIFDRDLFDELFDVKCDEVISDTCQHRFLVIDGKYTCTLCGNVDPNKCVFYETLQKPNYKPYYIYRRKSYFREKMRLLTGIKQPMNDEYNDIIKSLKAYEFNNIFELKRIMRKQNMSIYYKFIYHIYFEIKNEKLIPLTPSDIEKLIYVFIALEWQFKRNHPGKHSLLSYNIVIYCILRDYNYLCYKHILLPKNYKKIVKIIDDLLKVVKSSGIFSVACIMTAKT